MDPKWTDFEKFVFKFLTETIPAEFAELNTRISRIEGRAAVWGAIGGATMVILGEIVAKTFAH